MDFAHSLPALTTTGSSSNPALRRMVFYFGGFDPAGPAKYHALFTREGAKQADLGRYSLDIGERETLSSLCAAWNVHYKGPDGSEASTRYHVMRWDDLVRTEWPRSGLAVLRRCLDAGWRLATRGRLLEMARLRPSAALTLVLPSLLPLLAALATTVALPVSLSITSRFGWWSILPTMLGWIALIHSVRCAWTWTQAGWLGRSAYMILEQASGRWPALDQRLSKLTEFVEEQMQRHPSDEVLIIGHSSGAMLASSVAARVLRNAPDQALSLLTLGQCIPVLSYQPEAAQYRSELSILGSAGHLTWLDFSAPVDGCCFALSDPLQWPKDLLPKLESPRNNVIRMNPRFYRLFSPPHYEALKRDKLRCHFQYLKGGDVLAEYDFFRLCAGPTPLGRQIKNEATKSAQH